jgi:hypothetical protein
LLLLLYVADRSMMLADDATIISCSLPSTFYYYCCCPNFCHLFLFARSRLSLNPKIFHFAATWQQSRRL